jgi:hypothetical protein|uniref:Uncharacterized protein n=1 Tax=uncultured Caudovirales phage TaxID=2100421 RepID=A0A6J5KYL5_9CAUD|nr:hypothetical protein UFOVP88_44 [uncultured Caudovirales phage]
MIYAKRKMDHKTILEMTEEKWGEHLEMLAPDLRYDEVVKILINTIISQQAHITFLTRLRDVQESFIRAEKSGMARIPEKQDRC